jgi:uncharacterized protein
VGADELETALNPDFAAAARDRLTEIGFDHVTLDLDGYRTGSVSPEGEASAEDEPLVENVFDAEYPVGE